jgi:hypothetical protein
LLPDSNIKFCDDSAEDGQQLHDMDITATEGTSTPLRSIADVKGNNTISSLPFAPLIAVLKTQI